MFRSDRFKQLRENRRYTHSELAEMLGVGYSQIYRLEAGLSDPQTALLDRISEVFGVSVEYLLGRTEDFVPSSVPLSEKESQVISALRQGDTVKAIKAIVSE